jgi:hypothetical protein
MSPYEEVQAAIDIILLDEKAYNKSLNYAISYCREAKFMYGDELRVQCAYILNNITHWRHPLAKEVRTILKKYVATKILYKEKTR